MRFLIVDDHPIMRLGVKQLIQGHWPSAVLGRLERQQPMLHREVVLVLPAVAVKPLTEVALVVVEPDAHKRNPEV
mgnify:CR=1 FL=1